MKDVKNNKSFEEATITHSSLADMYERQEAQLEEKNVNVKTPPSRIGIVLFTSGLLLILSPVALKRPETDILVILIAVAFCFIISGIFLLRESLSVIKPLIAGSFLATLGFPAIGIGILLFIEGFAKIEAEGIFFIVISSLLLFFGIPTTIASLCAIIRRKHRWAIVGAMFGLFISIIIVIVIEDPVPIILALTSLLLLIMSEGEFKD